MTEYNGRRWLDISTQLFLGVSVLCKSGVEELQRVLKTYCSHRVHTLSIIVVRRASL